MLTGLTVEPRLDGDNYDCRCQKLIPQILGQRCADDGRNWLRQLCGEPLGGEPLGRERGAKAEQLEQVAAGSDQRPLAIDLIQASQQQLPEPPTLLDLAEDRLHCCHPKGVTFPTLFRQQLPPHPVPGGQMIGDAETSLGACLGTTPVLATVSSIMATACRWSDAWLLTCAPQSPDGRCPPPPDPPQADTPGRSPDFPALA